MSGIREPHPALPSGRRKSLRAPLVLLILVPSLLLAGLWGYAAVAQAGQALGLRGDTDLARSAAGPANGLLTRLQEERRLTAVWQAGPSASRADLEEARDRTDSAVGRLREEALPELRSSGSRATKAADDLAGSLDRLTVQRDTVDGRKQSAIAAFSYYTETADRAMAAFEAATRSDDGRLANGAAAVRAVVAGHEMLSRQDALLSSALTAGRMTTAAHDRFTRYAAAHEQIRTSLAPADLPGGERDAYQEIIGGARWDTLLSIQDAVAKSAAGLPGQAGQWRAAADRVIEQQRAVGRDSLDAMTDEGSSRADVQLITAIAGSVAALAVAVLALVLALRLSRSLVSRLAALREESDELAESRLPYIVGQLAMGERVDLEAHQPTRTYGRDEVGQLADSLHGMRRTVLATTVQQARGREGTKKVFVNLARRTQVLIHRQISMLDSLERKHEDPELLEDLFAVDHLATRVRRHAENLVILGGSLPARRWSDAVPVVNVLRSALSETETYTRVKVLPVPRYNLVGQAVADVVHLVAELIENGTSFSPPDTQVSVGAEKVTKGLVIEVEDRGLGLPDDEYDRINQLLATAPELDMMALGEDPRLGLFVVARLAGRHGIEVSLRKSPYGGTRAIVLLPNTLLEEPKSPLAGIPGLPIGGHAAISAPGGQGQPEAESPGGSLFPFPRVGQQDAERPRSADIRTFPEQRPPFGQRSAPVQDPFQSRGQGPDEEAHTRPAAQERPEEPPAESARPRVLPKRVRQASLVDQLREAAALGEQRDADEGGGADSEGHTEPSPQQSGATMAAIQRETRRARETQIAEPPGEEEPWQDSPGHDASAGSSVVKEEG